MWNNDRMTEGEICFATLYEMILVTRDLIEIASIEIGNSLIVN